MLEDKHQDYIIIYSYLMGVQAIYQNIFPEVLGKTKVLYCPMTTVEVSRTLVFHKIEGVAIFYSFVYSFDIFKPFLHTTWTRKAMVTAFIII
jgi:hypothetical protein